MTMEEIIKEVEPLGSSRTKKRYMSQGAVEPLFGLTIKALKPIANKLKAFENHQQLAYDLFDTGNYDLMYLAGMIVDSGKMPQNKYDEWMDQSYFYMIGDFIVAICLSETDFAKQVADRWIKSGEDLRMSAGYSTYCWLLGSRKDEYFEKEKLQRMLAYVEVAIQNAPNRTRYAMYYFVYNLGISYLPLHQEALNAAKNIGEVIVFDEKGEGQSYHPLEAIKKEVERNRLGFKRKYVRC